MKRRIDVPIMLFRGEAPGAIPNGRRIEKSKMGEGDYHPIGAKGKVLASKLIPPEVEATVAQGETFAYFVEWDTHPGVPVAIMGSRIREASD